MTTAALAAKRIIPFVDYAQGAYDLYRADEPSATGITHLPLEGAIPGDVMIHILTTKSNRRASETETDAIERIAIRLASQERVWIRIGATIVVGLLIFIIGSVLRYIVPGPLPYAVAAFGMLLIVFALGYGGYIQKRPITSIAYLYRREAA